MSEFAILADYEVVDAILNNLLSIDINQSILHEYIYKYIKWIIYQLEAEWLFY